MLFEKFITKRKHHVCFLFYFETYVTFLVGPEEFISISCSWFNNIYSSCASPYFLTYLHMLAKVSWHHVAAWKAIKFPILPAFPDLFSVKLQAILNARKTWMSGSKMMMVFSSVLILPWDIFAKIINVT